MICIRTTDRLLNFLKKNIEPQSDLSGEVAYFASAYLTDGTYLPCVVFKNPNPLVNLAIKRFKEEKKGGWIFRRSEENAYKKIVKAFVVGGNSVKSWQIARVEKSPYAIPARVVKQIRGETAMGWTGFAAKMKGGKIFGFGTTFSFEFFQMPEGYSAEDIIEIVNHSYVLKDGSLHSHRENNGDYKNAVVYRERVFFECYIDGL